MGALVAQMNLTKGDGPVMRTFLDTVNDVWDSMTMFVHHQLGLSNREIQQLKDKYLD